MDKKKIGMVYVILGNEVTCTTHFVLSRRITLLLEDLVIFSFWSRQNMTLNFPFSILIYIHFGRNNVLDCCTDDKSVCLSVCLSVCVIQ